MTQLTGVYVNPSSGSVEVLPVQVDAQGNVLVRIGNVELPTGNFDLAPYLKSSDASTVYLKKSDAAQLYATQDALASATTGLLTTSAAAAAYLSQTSAATIYLSQSAAASIYLTISAAAGSFLSAAAASGTYETIANVSAKVPLSVQGQLLARGASTNIAIAPNTSATPKFLTQVGDGTTAGTPTWSSSTTDLSAYSTTAVIAAAYLTQANAASTYLTQANATSTYLSQSNATATYLSIANAITTYIPISGASSFMRASVFPAVDGPAALVALGVDFSPYLLAAEASILYMTPEEVDAAYSEDIQVFTTAGTTTWTKPVGAKTMDIIGVGGSGGGGSGARQPTGTTAFGGGGAGMTPMFIALGIEADQFGATETVIIGDKGVGGAAVTTNGTNGNNGTDGGVTKFGTLFQALGGKGGLGGTTTAGTGGAVQFQCIGSTNGNSMQDATKGGDSGTTSGGGVAGAPYSITANNGLAPTSSGSGGSISSSNVAYAGQASMGIYNQMLQTMPNSGAAGGANTGGAGTAGTIINLGTHRKIWTGGGGGGANLTGPGGAGGSPGGGGGASRDGNNSGKGADGFVGYCVVITHCG